VIKSAFLIGLLAASAVCGLAMSGCSQKADSKPMSTAELITRGGYLVTIGGCNDCHSPKVMTPAGPVPDMQRLLSGHPENLALPALDANQVDLSKWALFNMDLTAAVGPWGASFAANLTPDEETGIGAWSETNFIQALRTGKHMGAGRPILPPMPWFNFAKATDEDLQAIFAYLRSLPPVKNHVPQPIPPTQLSVAARP
jgi:mono/diheme cytochrome c family protein